MQVGKRILRNFVLRFQEAVHGFAKIQRVSLLAPLRIDGEIDRDPINPGVERRTALKALNLAISSKKSFLRDLQRVFAVAEQTENHHVNLLMVTRDQLLERADISRLAPSYQLQVVRLHNDSAF